MAFEAKHLNNVADVMVCNQRTAIINPGDGTIWRVDISPLRRVLDL